MSSKADAGAVTVDQLYSKFYVIPDFQREYTWKPRHVKALLNDLLVAHTTGVTDDCSLGSLIVYGEGKRQHVVDGQQRLSGGAGPYRQR